MTYTVNIARDPSTMTNPATCAETDCPTPVPDTPDQRCNASTGAGCGELFCGEHLYVTYRDGYLCGADYDHIEDRPVEDLPDGAEAGLELTYHETEGESKP